MFILKYVSRNVGILPETPCIGEVEKVPSVGVETVDSVRKPQVHFVLPKNYPMYIILYKR